MDTSDDFIDQSEKMYQEYESIIHSEPLDNFLNHEETKKHIYTHIGNYCNDVIEPLLEKAIYNWKMNYNIQDNVCIDEILPIIMYHLDYNEIITKKYIQNNPECVQTYIEYKLIKQQESNVDNDSTYKKYTPNIKEF